MIKQITKFIIIGALDEGKHQYYNKEKGWVNEQSQATLYLTNHQGYGEEDALCDWWKLTNNGKICPKPFKRVMIANNN